MKKRFPKLARGSVRLILLVVVLLSMPLGQGRAQGTTVLIDPQSSEVAVGATTAVDIRVDNVTDLFGAEVHLAFDPALLEVVDADSDEDGVQIQPGTLLSPDFTAQNEVDQGSGTIDFAISQMKGKEPVSGSGVLATITFRGKAANASDIRFRNVILAQQGGIPIDATTQNGRVTVTTGVTPTPSATPTQTPVPTGTPTATPETTPTTPPSATPTATSTPTPIPGTSVTFDPRSASVRSGETVQVKLHVANAVNLYKVEIHLTHGNGIDATALTPGPCVADLVPVASVEENRVDYTASLQAPSPPVNGACDLATITFRGLEDGSHTVSFASALLSDPDGNSLSVTTAAGTIVVYTDGEILGHHTVQPRETLYCIGRAYGVDPYAIARQNSILNPNIIHPGHRLAIPNVPRSLLPGRVCPRQFDGVTPPPTCRLYHTVAHSENLYRIALRYGVSMWAIAEANHILNLNYVRAGQVLCIP